MLHIFLHLHLPLVSIVNHIFLYPQTFHSKVCTLALMKLKKKQDIWLSEPEKHDYPAAKDYLELHFSSVKAAALAKKLQAAKVISKKAKDILRASSLPLLDKSNVHVKANIDKVREDKKLSPVLLVRGEKLIIADGYHRVCAIYYLSEDLSIPCKIV